MFANGFTSAAEVAATGDDYGKLKLWNTASGFCYVTFNEHKAPVSDIVFSPLGHSVFSCSLDGTVRYFFLPCRLAFRAILAGNSPFLSALLSFPLSLSLLPFLPQRAPNAQERSIW